MSNRHMKYHVYLDRASRPQMYGIRSHNGICVGRISTDFQEVNRLAECCNSANLSSREKPPARVAFFRRV